MNDVELQRLVLKKYYEKRHFTNVRLKPKDFDFPITDDDIIRMSMKLKELNLINIKEDIDYKGIKTFKFGNIKIEAISKLEKKHKVSY